MYTTFALAMLVSIVFAPFSLQALRLAVLALDGGITLEPTSQWAVMSTHVRKGGAPFCSCVLRDGWAALLLTD